MSQNYGPSIVRDGLVLYLDAANPKSYPGSGATWYDLSGNGNHFTLYNSPTFNSNHFAFISSSSHWARSTSTVDLTGFERISVECAWKVSSVADNKFIFEHTANWNSNSGAFGAFTNSNGGTDSQPTTNNDLHMNSAVGRLDSGPVDDCTTFGISDWTFISGSGVSHYYNTVQPTESSATSSSSNFSNDYTYIGARGGTGFYDGTLYLSYIKIYGKALTEAEIKQNFEAHRGRFGL